LPPYILNVPILNGPIGVLSYVPYERVPDSVLASETEWTENCRAVYTAQTVQRDERERWESF